MMSVAAHIYDGSCHCGAIKVRLSFTIPPDEVQMRSCQCGFCTRQGAVTISDPAGRAVIEIQGGHISLYKFATQSAGSMICVTCGVYAGAVLQHGPRTWSIANTRGLAIEAFKGRSGTPMHYEHETADERIERRRQRWTPTELTIKV